ncbi:hypothetical protein ACI782_24820 [Geodermatophilus sp. SYSU D00703]
MTEDRERTAAVRDVPPPRPVVTAGAASPPAEEGPLARAGRKVADAVSGLLGGGSAGGAEEGRRSATATTLRDVASAVASAAGSLLGGGAGDRDRPQGGAAPTAEGETGWAPGAVLGDLLAAAAPRLPIRDGRRLREAYPGATDEEIADALVERAVRLTGAIGAATGGITAASWFAPASLVALPLELGAETVLTAAVEVVLIGELHEVYGRPAPGDARARAAAYLSSWSSRRAVDDSPVPGLGVLLTGATVRSLRRSLARRMARTVPVAAPFLIGAALGGRGNRRVTEALARRVRADLRGSRP